MPSVKHWASCLLLLSSTLLPALLHAALTDAEKTNALNKQNQYRNFVRATNMNKLVWDTVLESAAQNYSQKCKATADPNRAAVVDNLVVEFGQLTFGEIIYVYKGGNSANAADLAADVWQGQSNNFQLPTTCSPSNCAEYKQMIYAVSTAVGCASHFCTSVPGVSCPVDVGCTVVVCDYLSDVTGATAVYETGTPCSRCGGTCRTDTTYTNLCIRSQSPSPISPKEKIDGDSGILQLEVTAVIIACGAATVAGVLVVAYRYRKRRASKILMSLKTPRSTEEVPVRL